MSRLIYAILRGFITTLVASGSTLLGLPRKGDAAAFAYEAVLRLTFGTARAEQLAHSPKADVRKLAPPVFGEVFEDKPVEAKDESLALPILGIAGVVLMVAVIIGAGICIEMQRLQPKHPTAGVTIPPAATKPADTPASNPAAPAKGVPSGGLNLDPISKAPPAASNQAAPNAEPGSKAPTQLEAPAGKSPPPNAQQQQQQQQQRKDEIQRPKQAN
ncbi:hypothetical protein QA641_23720 [Bradyrhizobium sp. CB1650]|uniref:hypothetical protein n=1 Tax=Bradyrhizobium sp. CB1650 TaxID=3039153 RepID=UPI002435BBC0|nr:hypothetical protein [Bradyrhizobium sp. CB1650]WGD48661.1 hypothetical protein QA641_23720 [Bradyrhizobium sp. CB1650]